MMDRLDRPALTLICALVAALAAIAYSPKAQACGGLFCNNQQTPVNQTAERIIFSKNDDGTVTAVVQIMYQGPSDEFAWVLPVPGAPEVDVSSDVALNRLQSATNPVYRLTTRVEGECSTGGASIFPSDSANTVVESANNASIAPGEEEDDPVDVVSSGSIGPYNHTTISVEPGTPDPEDAAMEWLDTNGYNTTSLAPDLIRDYLDDGMNLLAVKLQKDSDSGNIRPIRITYDSELPMIPIKLTAVAANDDMGVMVWVLGQQRAIPTNYKTLELNQALINWFNPGATYNQIVNQAADEAGGQGFVTEFAGPVDEPIVNQGNETDLEQTIFTLDEASDWGSISGRSWEGREGQLLQESTAFSNWDGYVAVVSDHVPLPSGTTPENFAQCPGCTNLVNQGDIQGFDPQTFIDQLYQRVVGPMEKTQDLVNAFPYMTRLYTTMSAGDMTLDPVFDFNAQLGDHPNIHDAERVIECAGTRSRSESPWSVELTDGSGYVYGTGRTWPFSIDESGMPATRRIVQHQSMGDGTVVENNAPEIDDVVGEHNQEVSNEFSGGLRTCSTGSGTPVAGVWLLLGLFGLRLFRRSPQPAPSKT
jgi:hypothetical protein